VQTVEGDINLEVEEMGKPVSKMMLKEKKKRREKQ